MAEVKNGGGSEAGPSGQSASGSGSGIGSLVASHYNNLDERGKEFRSESRIYHMRNLNNWIKSQLVNEYMDKVKRARASKADAADTADAEQPRQREPVMVLDLGCGKGGDLLKWQKAGIDHLVCCDIAETSVRQCESRYREMRSRNRHQRLFSAEFHTADCTKERTRDLYREPDHTKFDIVSAQFSFHYCFESLPQAECMLRNVSENLKPGGYFIGTTPDAYDIVNRLRNSGTNKVGNSVYSVEVAPDFFDEDKPIPLFGAQYNFHLEGVVDCPEFLVHFPTLTKLAEKYGLFLIAKRRFGNYFQQFRDQGKSLLMRMRALETYPAQQGAAPAAASSEAAAADNYAHGDSFLKSLQQQQQQQQQHEGDGRRRDGPGQERIGTLSKDEWEAATLYVIFAFKKMNI